MDLYDRAVLARQSKPQAEKDLQAELARLQREPQERPAGKFAEALSMPAAEQMRVPRTQQPEPEKESSKEAERMKHVADHSQGPPSPGGAGYTNSRAWKAPQQSQEVTASADIYDRAIQRRNEERAKMTPEQALQKELAELTRKEEFDRSSR